ncbi:MAG: hypothetical protein RI900_1321 [Actinomycetota bacterium]|jgi:hypothetical protein
MRRIVLLLIAVVFATGCGSDPVADPAALRFTAPLVGGGTLDASTLADKPTVFWFWAPG